MLSVMMVLGMASVVSAAGTTETGTITINDAINGQKYTIYKLLDLESYDKDKNLYSYKPAAEWKTFFEPNEQGKEYVDINANGYVLTLVTTLWIPVWVHFAHLIQQIQQQQLKKKMTYLL